jgi:polysaccharide deacetylase family protein (PEP-CTERM system associated)
MFNACDPDPALVSVDVEDYFVSPETIPFSTWADYPSRIEIGINWLLELFAECNIEATFFFLGWVAERYPELVQCTADAGHEIASHGYNHDAANKMTPDAFSSMLKTESARLSDITGQQVLGYRAPMFSLTRTDTAHYQALAEAGFTYDSSVMPYRSYLYGDAGAPLEPYRITPDIWELPPLVVNTLWGRFPAAGGFYLRALPLFYSKWALRKCDKEDRPAVLYLHPWEYDPKHPCPPMPTKQRLIHNAGLKSARRKLRSILKHRATMTMKEYCETLEEEN